jgi:protein TonB
MRMLLAVVLAAGVAGAQDAPTVYTPGNGVSLPAVTRQVKAEYTNEAKQNRIEGSVGLEVVVQSDGTVGDVRVKRSLDAVYGLDQQAVKAMKQWEFRPGMKDGKPVAVRVAVEMNFSLK